MLPHIGPLGLQYVMANDGKTVKAYCLQTTRSRLWSNMTRSRLQQLQVYMEMCLL